MDFVFSPAQEAARLRTHLQQTPSASHRVARGTLRLTSCPGTQKVVSEAEACTWKALAETLEYGVAIGEAVFKLCEVISELLEPSRWWHTRMDT